MDPTDRLVAIVAGSLAGLIILLASVAIAIWCCLGRRRRTKRKDPRHFAHHQLSPHSDSSLSKHSTLSQPDPRLIDPRNPRLIDPRLPKVGSSNLWFGTPSLYCSGPSDAYQGMRKTSDNRPQPTSQLTLQAAPAGHMVYQGRIFHSQHVGLQQQSEMYDSGYRLPRTGSYMDVYGLSYNYDPTVVDMTNSRAMLVDYVEPDYYLDRYREREVRRTGKRIRRSQSDVTLHSTKRPKNRKQRGVAPFDKTDKEKQTEKRDSLNHEGSHDSYEHKRKSYEQKRNSYEHKHDSYEKDRRSRRESDERGIERERNTITAEIHKPRKSAPPPPKPRPYREESQSKSLDLLDPDSLPSATDSAKLRALEKNREKEQLRQSGTHAMINDLGRDNHGFNTNGSELNDLHIKAYKYEGKPSQYESPVVAKMAALTDTPRVVRHHQSNIISKGDDFGSRESFHAEVSRKLEKIQDGVKDKTHVDLNEGPVATSTGKHSRSSRSASGKGHHRRGSNVTDQDGKIVTAEAFGFLDGYSDGEGTDFICSGEITPTQARDYDINL